MRIAAIVPIFALVLAAGAVASADGGAREAPAEPASVIASVPPGTVDGPTARRLVAAGIRVVDVRTPEEFLEGHIPGAVNIPYDEIPRRANELGPPSTPLLLYCRTGRRTAIAAESLREKGFTRLYDLRSYGLWVASAPAAAR